eukprot:g4546.t1
MLAEFIVFSRTGLIFWSKGGSVLRGNPVDDFIKNVILESKINSSSYSTDSYTLKWTLANETKPGLVFLCIYSKSLQLSWVTELLNLVKTKFIKQHAKNLNVENCPLTFDFEKILHKAMGFQPAPQAISPVASSKDKSKGETKEALQPSTDFSGVVQVENEEEKKTTPDGPVISSPKHRPSFVGRRQRRAGPGGFKKKDKTSGKKDKNGKKSLKKQPSWKQSKFTQEAADALDMTNDMDATEEEKRYQERVREMREKMEGGEGDDNWVEGYDDDDDDEDGQSASGGFFGSFMNLIGNNRVLQEGDLTTILNDMKEHLVKKNVGHDVAQDLSDSVKLALVGSKLGNFKQVKETVRNAFEKELSRILTPKKSTDIVQDIRRCNAEGNPYSIVFIGVNGVGKSTSLSKVCYYLLQQRFKVLIAACDTFRSGAVEQLKVHSDCLGVPVFDQGYKRDPAHVAKEAIQHAKENNVDVVLVDTAGRMQNNQPLMIALSKIITMNKPNLILFVGEAIVGNDALDQLTEFNRALMDNATEKTPRLIDGIILTKFDCVDDKVGTAVSMVHKTGQPIMFVGTGQKYTHLRRLNVPTVVNSLMK